MSPGHESLPLPMTLSSNIFNDFNYLPEAFNSFFTSVFTFTSPYGQLSFLPNHYTTLLSDLHLTPNDVLLALLKLKSKFNSPDGIPAFFFKTFAPLLVFPLTTIFNFSNKWKFTLWLEACYSHSYI